MTNDFPYILVVIDMQPRFEAARNEQTQRNIIAEIEEAKRNSALIVVLEYTNYGYNRPISMQRTVQSIVDAIGDYNYAVIVEKSNDDGSCELMQALDAWGLEGDDQQFRICGVNWGACVEATVLGMIHDYAISGDDITVLRHACNQPTHWKWDGTLDIFESNGVYVDAEKHNGEVLV